MSVKYWLLGLGVSLALVGSLLVALAPKAYAADCGASGGIPSTGLPIPGGSTDCTVSSCAYENLGWILCPVLRASAQAADYAFTFVNQNFMKIDVGLTNPSSGAAQAGSVIRNIANVLFVIVMLIIIYTFVTGQGVSNYNLKRMAPRFIVAVILVQASFFVCQIFVDISNILGVGVRQILVEQVADKIGPSAMPLADEAGKNDTETLSKLVSGVVAKDELAWQLLAPLAAVVMSIAVVSSIIIIVLIIRKTLVVALVLLAPIAFVAYLLPNTSDYFSKWLRMFIYTLVLFPVISLLIGTGQIVSASILKAGANDYKVKDDTVSGVGGTGGSATLYLVAAGAAVLPLVGTWYAFKVAMSAFDAAGAAVTQRGSRRTSREREEDVKKREQTAMDMNKKSMMMRGVNRLQQLNVAKDGESTSSIFGRVGAYRGRNKHQAKSPEQARFDNQVQQRLSELRSNASGRSPQELYSQALQRYQDKMGGDDAGDVNINSYEGIDLKASEAYLLESLGKGMGASSSFNVAVSAAGDKKEDEKKSAGISSLDKDKNKSTGGGSGGNGQAPQDPYRPPQSAGAQAAANSGAAAQAGATVIVQQVAPGGEGAGTTGSTDAMANGTGFAPRRPSQTNNELLAKARAAKYVADTQSALDQAPDVLEEIAQQAQDNTTPRDS